MNSHGDLLDNIQCANNSSTHTHNFAHSFRCVTLFVTDSKKRKHFLHVSALGYVSR
jgi:hypothetical protein